MPRVHPTGAQQGSPGGAAWALQDNTLKGPWSFRSKEVVQCLCEGGRFCTREDPQRQKGGNAIPGLHSSWVGQQRSILAMARPWQASIQRHHLVDAFLQNNIGMVLNLQEVGEHSTCGPGNLPQSGFTYNPYSFMAARIGVYNFSWRDMGVPDLDKMMDIVQVMEHVILGEGRKVAVHCHAGLGRTGLAIACSLVYSQHYTARRAVSEVRQHRPGALQTKRQELFVYVFEQYLAHLRCVLPTVPPAAPQSATSSPTKAAASSHEQPGAEELAAESAQLGTMSAAAEPASNGRSISETYPCGLVIVRPARQPGALPAKGGAVQLAADGSMTAHELGLDHVLPWNQQFDIQPDKFNKEWQPHPPRTYQEALLRQQRLLHGPARRTFRNVHRCVAQTLLAIIDAARMFGQGGLPVGAAPPHPQLQPAQSLGPAAAAASLPVSAPPPPAGAATASASYSTRSSPSAAATSILTASGRQSRVSPQLAVPAVAGMTSAAAVAEGIEFAPFEAVQQLPGQVRLWEAAAPTQPPQRSHRRASAAAGAGAVRSWPAGPVCEGMQHAAPAPVAQAGMELQGAGTQPACRTFADALLLCARAARQGSLGLTTTLGLQPCFARFTGPQPDASQLAYQQQQLVVAANFGDTSGLATAPLAVTVALLHQLMAGLTRLVPAVSKQLLECARDHYSSLPYDVQPGSEVQQFAAAHKLLGPLPASDQELLLLFAAMLRHAVRASGGAGCEPALVELCDWVMHMLVGAQLQGAPAAAHEALTSFLWYLVRNDVAYATLILLWQQRRLMGKLSKPPAYLTATQVAASAQPVPLLQAEGAAAAAQPPPLLPVQARSSNLRSSRGAGLALPPMLPRAQAAAGSPPIDAPHPGVGSSSGLALPPFPGSGRPTLAPLGDAGVAAGIPRPSHGASGAALPAPPLAPPPAYALSPAPAGVGPRVQGPAEVVHSVGPDGRPDARLYGGLYTGVVSGLGEGAQAQALKQQLEAIPATYIPPTAPGTQQMSIHDVRM